MIIRKVVWLCLNPLFGRFLVRKSKVSGPNATVGVQDVLGAVLAKFTLEFLSGILHELVAVAAAFEDAGFQAAGLIGDRAGGNLLEQRRQIAVQQ